MSPAANRISPAQLVVEGRRWALAWITITAFLGGLAEAMFLTAVTATALAITADESAVELLGWSVAVSTVLIVALGLVAARLALALGAANLSTRLMTSANAELRTTLARAFLEADWETQQNERSGGLQELLTTYSSQASALVGAIGQTFLYGANLIAMVGLAIVVDPAGAAVLVVSVGALGSLLRPLRSAVRRRARAASEANMEFAVSLNEVSQLGMELHVFNVQDQAMARVDGLIVKTREISRRVSFLSSITSPLYSGVAYIALLGALALVAASEATDLKSLGAVMLVMLRSLGYGQALQSAYTSIAQSTPAVEILQERLHYYERGRRHDGGVPVPKISSLRVNHIWFSYTVDQPVLKNIDFSIEPREVIGIVGPSGGGKSTLVQLLLGLREPDSGAIEVDGRDIRELDRRSWARRVTFVPQAAHLFVGSVADNIRFLRPDVSEEDIIKAAQLAHLDEDIRAFPEGYSRSVGERGGHLSGGQQQRLCIARALVEKPDVLILDEPTSALDVRSEHLIRSTLLGLKERMTVIVIAHRLSTLDICDRIMVIQGGEIKGFDTPERLEQSNDFYREALVLSGMR